MFQNKLTSAIRGLMPEFIRLSEVGWFDDEPETECADAE